MKESSREEGRRLQERQEYALRDDVQEELPAAGEGAAAAAGWKRGSTEGPFQPQEARLVQELQGAPAGAEERRGRVAKRAKSPPPTPSTSSSSLPSSPTPSEASDVPAAH